jgi:hypothetical protein
MLARAPERPTPRPPSIGTAMRRAGVDLYFNSLRFVPANLLWGLAALGIAVLVLAWPPAIVLSVALGPPLAGIFRMAALLARGEPASFGDFVGGIRRYALPAVSLAAAALGIAIVLVTNVVLGFGGDLGPIGWFLGASALYGLVALAMFLVAVWPILVDPGHEGVPAWRRVRLAGLVVIGRPGRLFALTALLVAALALATVLLGALLMVGVAFAAILATRWTLPTLDHLEARLAAASADRSARPAP